MWHVCKNYTIQIDIKIKKKVVNLRNNPRCNYYLQVFLNTHSTNNLRMENVPKEIVALTINNLVTIHTQRQTQKCQFGFISGTFKKINKTKQKTQNTWPQLNNWLVHLTRGGPGYQRSQHHILKMAMSHSKPKQSQISWLTLRCHWRSGQLRFHSLASLVLVVVFKK